MNGEPPRAPEPETAPAESGPRTTRRLQIGVRGLIVVVACSGVILWAARSLWENQNPAVSAARGLEFGNPSERVDAAHELAAMATTDPRRSIPPLLAAIGDSEARVRIATAQALGAIASSAIGTPSAGDVVPAATRGLARLLKDRDPAVRLTTVRALLSMGLPKGTTGSIDPHEVVVALAEILGDRDDEVRLAAFGAIEHYGPLDPAGPPAALVAALEERSVKIRTAAIRALASFSCNLDPWLPFLLRCSEQDEPPVRYACWLALARWKPPAVSAAAIPSLLAALGSKSRIVRSHAAIALHPYMDDPSAVGAIPALLAMIREPSEPDRSPLRPDPPRPEIDWNGPDPAWLASKLLGSLSPGTESTGAVIAALAEVVRSGDPNQRFWAASALGQFGPAAEAAIPALIEALRKDVAHRESGPYLDVSAFASALGRIAPGTKSADGVIDVLIASLQSHERMREMAIVVLPRFGWRAARAIPQLRAVRDGKDARLGPAAARALKEIEAAESANHTGDRKASR
jgi:HEAT repeat protein